MKKEALNKAVKQLQNAANNLHDAGETDAGQLVSAIANAVRYGKTYRPQVEGYAERFSGTLTDNR